MMEKNLETDSPWWSMDDASAAVGLTRQRLNTLVLEGRYKGEVVPYRPPRTDSTGKPRRVRFRLLSTDVVEQIKQDQEKQEEAKAEVKANAIKRKAEAAKRPKKKRGRPKGSKNKTEIFKPVLGE